MLLLHDLPTLANPCNMLGNLSLCVLTQTESTRICKGPKKPVDNSAALLTLLVKSGRENTRPGRHGSGPKPRVVAGPPLYYKPLSRPAIYFKPFVGDFLRLWLNILPQGSALFLGGCLGGVCRRTPPSVTNLSQNGGPSLLQTQCF